MELNHEVQEELERRYAKNQTNKRIRQMFEEKGFHNVIEKMGMPVDFFMSFLVQIALHKRVNFATMVGILRYHYNDTQMTAQGVEVALAMGLAKWDEMTEMVIVNYDIDPHVQREIDTYQFPLPMVEQPVHVTRNNMTGYRTIKGSLILKDNHHDDDICLDHINRVNSVPLSLNFRVVRHIQNEWKGIGPYQPGEDVDKYQKRQKAFAKYDTCSREVIDFIAASTDEFYLTHNYDKRGRTYARGYYIQYQGNDWSKSIVMFPEVEAEYVTG